MAEVVKQSQFGQELTTYLVVGLGRIWHVDGMQGMDECKEWERYFRLAANVLLLTEPFWTTDLERNFLGVIAIFW